MSPALGRILVIAPHPDDEVLGCGGTIARIAAEGGEAHVAVVTRGCPPAFTEEMTQRVRCEAKTAHACLGVRQTHWLDLPAAQIAQTPHSTVNAALQALLQEVKPDTLLIPFVGDVHMDHQLIFLSSLVAARPTQAHYPRTIMAYETVSETNWNAPYVTPTFVPNVFIDIESTLDRKLEAASMFGSQMKNFPHERSIETLRALAIVRGTAVHLRAAEAFVLLRNVM
ncbi:MULTISPECIES: PIG-L deacetylase family protein [Mesorhizobium]|jgi:N-acetylglucosamine malate deacetylase 1|uniref:LmbE family N-acetylglucosaminyl deacetylase n=1 Tax=Rhizobium loti TaxID=381 RepID=A0A8E2W5X9_RHILI|nr:MULTISPECIES: PIG-L deacetylase family protein [Mesorhizobium]AZO41862.1 PIG-L family deacetylase [Mesorhizobium sp. M7D.F.Ca.US.005.01.1.1]PWJ86783.1 LmbE family N-acetylglucosaminyl deacetylase [Mesorhizobium loti]RUX91524.1 PIG-L family deacetylase [Mesorhizobium sp. M7D.F.Ca.US.004.01.2.1]RVA36242.1 PIG-L family deacetylase [Mesorhizobium sp. M7D.F.Ca.US.004.03.1.1]